MSDVIPGMAADIAEGIDLETNHPFFGSLFEADYFVNAAILPNLGRVNSRMRIIDFGGGQGLLAAHCVRVLRAQGCDPDAIVVDANSAFLTDARNRGLGTCEANLVHYTGGLANLAMMRLVLHYNPQHMQRAILANVSRHVLDDGLFALQFESGDVVACALRNRIADLCATWLGTEARFWVDRQTMCPWLNEAGFGDVRCVSEKVYESDVVALVRNAWRRQRGMFERIGRTEEEFYRACADEIFTFNRTNESDALYYKAGRLMLRTVYPIVVAQKMTTRETHTASVSSVLRQGALA